MDMVARQRRDLRLSGRLLSAFIRDDDSMEAEAGARAIAEVLSLVRAYLTGGKST